jgi:hypothetical protein
MLHYEVFESNVELSVIFTVRKLETPKLLPTEQFPSFYGMQSFMAETNQERN